MSKFGSLLPSVKVLSYGEGHPVDTGAPGWVSQCLCGRHVVVLCSRERLHVCPCTAAGELREELSTPCSVSNAGQTAGMQAPSWEIPITLLN